MFEIFIFYEYNLFYQKTKTKILKCVLVSCHIIFIDMFLDIMIGQCSGNFYPVLKQLKPFNIYLNLLNIFSQYYKGNRLVKLVI